MWTSRLTVASTWSRLVAMTTDPTRSSDPLRTGIANARHDNGIVAYGGSVFVATVMTWRVREADALACRVALSAFARFAG